jgi:hypothetical protein
MRQISALLVFAATVVWAQESHLTVGGDPSWKGLQIRFVSRVEPPGPNSTGTLPGGVIVEEGRAHHLINDPAHKSYFGYDIALEPTADGNAAQIRIEPLRPLRADVSGPVGWTLLRLPRYPLIPNVKVGDTVALDLLVNAATGQKIVDYLTLERRPSPKERESHDFTLADVELTLSQPQVWIDNKLEGSYKFPIGTSGSVVWFYLARHGRFNLSLFPSQKYPYKKNGVVSANTATFRDGKSEYRVESSGAIVPGFGVFNLYVWHEPEWPGLGESFEIGSESAGAHLVIEKN